MEDRARDCIFVFIVQCDPCVGKSATTHGMNGPRKRREASLARGGQLTAHGYAR